MGRCQFSDFTGWMGADTFKNITDIFKRIDLTQFTACNQAVYDSCSFSTGVTSGEEHNSYDERGRVSWVIKRIQDADDHDMRNFYTAMEYDSMDRFTILTYPDQTTVNYIYNSRGLLESVPDIIQGYDYNPAGQNASLSLRCGIITDYDYDHRLRLSRLKTIRISDGTALQDLGYTYDSVSNITAITDNRATADLDTIGRELNILSPEARKFDATQTFTYDSLYRLTQASNPSVYGTITYRYDRIGNMIHKDADLLKSDVIMDLGGMTSGGTAGTSERLGRYPGDPPGPHAVTGTEKGPEGPMVFTYDDNGNLITDRGKKLFWDYKDRLIGLSNDEVTAQYIYDYGDVRKKKTVTNAGSGTTAHTFYMDKFSEIRDSSFNFMTGTPTRNTVNNTTIGIVISTKISMRLRYRKQIL